MGCERFGEAVSARLDGEVDAAEASVVDAHLAVCAQCRTAFARAALVNRLVAMHVPRPAPDLAAAVLAEWDTRPPAGASDGVDASGAAADEPPTCQPDRVRSAIGVAACGCATTCPCGCQHGAPCRCGSRAA